MAKRTKRKGKGISEGTATVFSGDDVVPAMRRLAENQAKLIAEHGSLFRAAVASANRWARKVLPKRGAKAPRPDSQRDYADRIQRYSKLAFEALDRIDESNKADAETAAYQVWLLAMTCKEADLKFRFDKTVLGDRKRRTNIGKSNLVRTAWVPLAAKRYMEAIPGAVKEENVWRDLAGEFGKSPGHIRKSVKSYLKRSSVGGRD